ncbi:hypothetical protein RHMOL_Rhmol07G0298200 [Rhododendron molle]|uniref:Uncharacterized protein n=1 Tax=Rhododendron molle TaxID=49168 RepID=A0ACC0N869_RHOML|nr:hypothetical protein RHMOL_Rhmol07G0298200 [Rhododendron molle]
MSTAIAVAAPAVVLGGLLLWLINWYFHEQKSGGSAVQKKSRVSSLPPVPEVPGLPVIGNALQLREGRPHMTFAKLAKKYGPIFSIRVGSKPIIGSTSHCQGDDVAKDFHNHVKNHGLQPVNFRDIYSSDIFGLALKEGNFERKVEKMYFRRLAVMKALIKEQTERAASGEEMNNCYLKYLLAEGKTLTEKEITSLVWEVIIESSDTTMITTEWALFELARNPKIQESLYEEIRSICGSGKVTEDNLCQLPFLDAVFHETLRKYPALPMVPLRYVNEDIELGGYYVPAGSEIAINLYGCNVNEKQWEKPDEWNPERFLNDREEYAPNDLYKTMAFGAGKRLCAGALQGVVVGSTTIGRLVQEFEWRLEDREARDMEIVGIATQKLRPMHAVIRPRNL